MLVDDETPMNNGATGGAKDAPFIVAANKLDLLEVEGMPSQGT